MAGGNRPEEGQAGGSAVTVVLADLDRADHQQAVLKLVDAYAREPMGSGKPLAPQVRAELIDQLRRHPTTLIFLAYRQAEAVGIAVCFRGFSTFAARPLVNLHDLAVLPAHRGHGVGRRLLEEVERHARATGCCKVTLEVHETNRAAQRIYAAAGFLPPPDQQATDGTRFLSKPL
jgi:ribosomal protein S18 acetylase RimI-like enzyme